MGREIRRVPPDWQHPKDENGKYKGLADCTWLDALRDWADGFGKFRATLAKPRDKRGLHDPDDEIVTPETEQALREAEIIARYSEYDGHVPLPDDDVYRPDFGDRATAYQVYETVSDGTPCSPVLETREALFTWLTTDGSGLGIGGKRQPMTPEQAEAFIDDGAAPTLINDSKGLRPGWQR